MPSILSLLLSLMYEMMCAFRVNSILQQTGMLNNERNAKTETKTMTANKWITHSAYRMSPLVTESKQLQNYHVCFLSPFLFSFFSFFAIVVMSSTEEYGRGHPYSKNVGNSFFSIYIVTANALAIIS